jgi:hypothetical protein
MDIQYSRDMQSEFFDHPLIALALLFHPISLQGRVQIWE